MNHLLAEKFGAILRLFFYEILAEVGRQRHYENFLRAERL